MFFIDKKLYALFPLNLITEERYKHLSANSKILYALLLNRFNLSKKNLSKFCDSNGLFIYYTNAQICSDLCCSVNSATNYLDELEMVGLIKKKHQYGQPTIIYIYDVFGMHEKSYVQEKANTYKPKHNFKPHSPVPQKEVSFDIERANQIVGEGTLDFGSMKNKKRRRH